MISLEPPKHFSVFAPLISGLSKLIDFPESLYLVPEPDEPFILLTEAIVREFPEYPPYGGKFTEIVPHLTVANRSAELSGIAEAELLEIMKGLRTNPCGLQCRRIV